MFGLKVSFHQEYYYSSTDSMISMDGSQAVTRSKKLCCGVELSEVGG